MHSFSDSLAKSKAMEGAEWWPRVYQAAFPGHLAAVSVRDDGWAQRGGIDRVVTLSSGKVITVDEKVRYKTYPDILLETWSSVEHKRPGWMQKDLACDFLAYAFVETEKCFLFPFIALRLAWLRNGREWLRKAKESENGFRICDARNQGYTTRSVAVPTAVVRAAISDAQEVTWS